MHQGGAVDVSPRLQVALVPLRAAPFERCWESGQGHAGQCQAGADLCFDRSSLRSSLLQALRASVKVPAHLGEGTGVPQRPAAARVGAGEGALRLEVLRTVEAPVAP